MILWAVHVMHYRMPTALSQPVKGFWMGSLASERNSLTSLGRDKGREGSEGKEDSGRATI